MSHQCYYCEQLFETKEKLYDHLEIHSEPVKDAKKKNKKKKTSFAQSTEVEPDKIGS